MSAMRVFFHPDQRLHHPRQILRLGRLCEANDLPERVDSLLREISARGMVTEVPAAYGIEPLLAVHTRPYLEFLSTAYDRWRVLPDAGAEVLPHTFPYASREPGCRSTSLLGQAGYYLGDLSVPLGPHTWKAALASAHCAVAAADAVMETSTAAFALSRPCGHHSHADRASGFCYLNNTSIAAQRLLKKFRRVAVLDIDAHHGDGTQSIFYNRPDVFTISVHGDPTTYYPFFSGYGDERGQGEGEGTNLNLPLAQGAGDAGLMQAIDQALLAIGPFRPEALVLALGFDTHRDDPLGILDVSTPAFRSIGERVRTLDLPTVVVQEGGYHIAVIGDCLGEFLNGFR